MKYEITPSTLTFKFKVVKSVEDYDFNITYTTEVPGVRKEKKGNLYGAIIYAGTDDVRLITYGTRFDCTCNYIQGHLCAAGVSLEMLANFLVEKLEKATFFDSPMVTLTAKVENGKYVPDSTVTEAHH